MVGNENKQGIVKPRLCFCVFYKLSDCKIGVFDENNKTYSLTLFQKTPPTPGQPIKKPFLIPLEIGLLDKNGNDMPLKIKGEKDDEKTSKVIVLNAPEQTFVFENVKEAPDIVLIHDGARPFVDFGIINRVIDRAEKGDGAVPALPVTDTIKTAVKTPEGALKIEKTVDRSALWRVQTPQAFPFKDILNAHEKAKGRELTCSAAENS